MSPTVILVEDLEETPEGGSYPLPVGAVVSSLAREFAEQRSIEFIETAGGLIALGADHGGFVMKERVRSFLKELGHKVHDFGVYDENPVDYPDIAHRVASAVSQGRCTVGIIVDGAGIGSCMAANKVPGIRAALCYDEKSARNSREHNYANVLTLGGRMIDEATVRTVVRTWLETPYGPERHKHRVEKITQIEKRYFKG